MSIIDQMKAWVDEVAGKNRDLEEEVKTLTLKLENSVGQVVDLQAKIRDLEEEVKVLKYGMTGSGIQGGVLDLERENKSLKLKHLELTVKYQMRKMWEMIILELKDSQPSSKLRKDGKMECYSNLRCEQPISPVIPQQEIPKETNPLENEKIVRRIVGYLQPKDLPKCRQVCKLWRKATQKDFEEKVTFYVRIRRHHIRVFMDCAAKSFPMFRNLKLDCISSAVASNRMEVSGLFFKYGQQLHKLQLDFGGNGFCGKSWSSGDFRYIFLNSLKEIRELRIRVSCHLIHPEQMFLSHHVKNILSNLTTLNIGLNCDECGSQHHHQVFIDFLRLFPNLKVLYWRSWGVHRIAGSTNFIESLLHVHPAKLEKLFILSEITDHLAISIAKSALNLNQLELYDVRAFKLHLVSSPYGKSEVVPRMTPLFSGNMDPALSTRLENTLAKCGNVSCTALLQVFMNILALTIHPIHRSRVRI